MVLQILEIDSHLTRVNSIDRTCRSKGVNTSSTLPLKGKFVQTIFRALTTEQSYHIQMKLLRKAVNNTQFFELKLEQVEIAQYSLLKSCQGTLFYNSGVIFTEACQLLKYKMKMVSFLKQKSLNHQFGNQFYTS